MIEPLRQWEGRALEIRFPLREYLGGDENSAVFVTEHSEPESLKAVIKLVRVDPDQGRRELSRAESTAKLSHSGLIRMFQEGLWRSDHLCLRYTVMECADENLAQVLSERPLTASEMHRVLVSTLDTLAYIHGAGFVHGHLKPANIMAVDDQIRISCDGLHRAGDSPGLQRLTVYDPPEALTGTITPAGDAWSLAVTMVEGLTQRLPVWEGSQKELILPPGLSSPFLEIARNCLREDLRQRWTTDQIADRLRRPESRSDGLVDLRLKWTSTLRRYALPLAILGLALAAIPIGERLFYPHPEVSQRVPLVRKQIGSKPVSKQVPVQHGQSQPQVLADYRRPSPFGSPQNGHGSTRRVLPREAAKSDQVKGSASRSVLKPPKPIVAAADTAASNSMRSNNAGATYPDPIAASSAERAMAIRTNETGQASFFSSSANGGRTASGARLNSEELMAAHASYPLGSRVRVTNLANGKTVEVRILDRFPEGSKRIINVSAAAARELDFIRDGTAFVRLELVR